MTWICWIIITIVALAVFFYLRRTRKERNALLQEKEIIFNFVHDVSEAFAESTNGVPHTDYLLKRVLFYAQQTAKARAGAIYFREPDGDTLRVRALSGLFPPIAGGVANEPEQDDGFFRHVETMARDQSARAGEGLVGTVAAQGVPLLIEDAERDQRVPRFRSEFLQIQSILLVPMRFQNTVLGVLVVVNRIDDAPFIQADLNLLQALADQASVTIYMPSSTKSWRRNGYSMTTCAWPAGFKWRYCRRRFPRRQAWRSQHSACRPARLAAISTILSLLTTSILA